MPLRQSDRVGIDMNRVWYVIRGSIPKGEPMVYVTYEPALKDAAKQAFEEMGYRVTIETGYRLTWQAPTKKEPT